jgi:PEP-CTERM motif-containing protein
VWRHSVGQTGLTAYSGADGDGDTIVDAGDFDVWRAHFGQTASGSGSNLNASNAVPEPSSLVLLLAALFVGTFRRRR